MPVLVPERYLTNFNTDQLPTLETDVLVIGSGNAGLRAAIEASHHCRVLVATKDAVSESNTQYAQGGIAVAMGVGDTVMEHIEDTLGAGDGLCDAEKVRIMVEEGIDRVKELIEWGAQFDRQGGELGFTLEAAHSRRRVIHAHGDATGAEAQAVLVTTVNKPDNVEVLPHAFVVDLLTDSGVCYGALVLKENALHVVRAKAVILAAGGLGQLYTSTSNPEVATGDGLAIAFRAGCEMMDMEFVQFHPTTLFLGEASGFLISEAVRGEGGILVNSRGEAFMESYHKYAELAPRDVVTRAIYVEMYRTNTPCVYLDITHLSTNFIHERFPTITGTCARAGIDITDTLIPVRPGAHFMMGGVRTNPHTETNIAGFYACGEAACTGVHGANRLASNSLLEGLVYGARAGKCAAEYVRQSGALCRSRFAGEEPPAAALATEAMKQQHEWLKTLMWDYVGITRHGQGLVYAIDELSARNFRPNPVERTHCELENMRLVGRLIAWAALQREESRGAHYRLDFPEQDNEQWHRHIVFDNTP